MASDYEDREKYSQLGSPAPVSVATPPLTINPPQIVSDVGRDVADAYRRGAAVSPAAGAGAMLREAATAPVSRAMDLPNPLTNVRAGIGDFIGGLVNGGIPAVPSVATPVSAPVKPVPPVVPSVAASTATATPAPSSPVGERYIPLAPPAPAAPAAPVAPDEATRARVLAALAQLGATADEVNRANYDPGSGYGAGATAVRVAPDGTKTILGAGDPNVDARKAYEDSRNGTFNPPVADMGGPNPQDWRSTLPPLSGGARLSPGRAAELEVSRENNIRTNATAQRQQEMTLQAALAAIAPHAVSAQAQIEHARNQAPLLAAQTGEATARAGEATARATHEGQQTQALKDDAQRKQQLLDLQKDLVDETDPAKQRVLQKKIAVLAGKPEPKFQIASQKGVDANFNPTDTPFIISTDENGNAVARPVTDAVPKKPPPAGMKLVGTSDGKPVYEDAKGKRFTDRQGQ